MDINVSEEKSKIAKRNIVLYASIALLLISLTFKFSYAYFAASLSGNESAQDSVVTSGDLKVEFTDSSVFNATDMVILTPEEVDAKSEKSTFTVKNTGNVVAKYKFLINTTLTSNLISSDFKWQLLSNSTVVSQGNFSTAVSGQDLELNSSYLTINPNDEVEYEFRVWLAEDETRNQIDLTNGTFSGLIKLQAIS